MTGLGVLPRQPRRLPGRGADSGLPRLRPRAERLLRIGDAVADA